MLDMKCSYRTRPPSPPVYICLKWLLLNSERLYPSNNENKGTELEPFGSVKQELGLDEVIPLEPEQLLLEGPGAYYEEKRKGYKGFKGDLNYPLDTSGYYGFESGDMDLGNLDPNHSLDPNHPFQCCICMKRYKSQGSLQNHRSLYHRDIIGQK